MKIFALTLPQATVNQAKGNFDGPHQAYQIDANDQLLTSKDYSSLVVAYRNGAPVILSDVARIIDGIGKHKAGRLDEQDAGDHREHSAAARRKHD